MKVKQLVCTLCINRYLHHASLLIIKIQYASLKACQSYILFSYDIMNVFSPRYASTFLFSIDQLVFFLLLTLSTKPLLKKRRSSRLIVWRRLETIVWWCKCRLLLGISVWLIFLICLRGSSRVLHFAQYYSIVLLTSIMLSNCT